MELVVGAIRVLGLGDLERFFLDWQLSELAQDVFRAPNVSGWPAGAAWLHAGHRQPAPPGGAPHPGRDPLPDLRRGLRPLRLSRRPARDAGRPPDLSELDEALALFFAAIDGSDRRGDVFVAVVSEFGRKVTANAGTDHGQSGLAVLVGGGVARGVFGEAPTLDPGGPTRPNRIHDAMRPIVDYRSLHATVLGRLARDGGGVTQAVLRDAFEDLGVFAPADRARITTPASGSELARGAMVTFGWTTVSGAAQYGFEFTGPDRSSPTRTGSRRTPSTATVGRAAASWCRTPASRPRSRSP